jgi:hypothetical protein
MNIVVKAFTVASLITVVLSNSLFAQEAHILNNKGLVMAQYDPSLAMVPGAFHHPSQFYYVGPPPELSDRNTNKYYGLSIDGLEGYLRDLEKDDPLTREKLQPDFDNLKSKVKTAKIVLWSGIGLGVGFIAYSWIANPQKPMPALTDPNWSPTLQSNANATTAAITGTALGVGIGLAGLLVAYIVSPGNDEYRSFVNKNNELSPKHQLKLKNLGLNMDANHSSSLAVSFSF